MRSGPGTGPLAGGRWLLPSAIAAILAGSVLWWAATSDPEVAFLPSRGTASWIVFPRVPRIGIRPAVEIETRFRRVFVLGEETGSVRLEYRAFRRSEIRINGAPVPATTGAGSWKKVRTADVGALLKAGENEISVTVGSDRGPPALWLSLLVPGRALETDGSWSASLEGSVWQPAEPASRAYEPARIDPDAARIRPWPAIRKRWRTLTVVALIALAALLAARAAQWVAVRRAAAGTGGELLLRGLVVVALGSWIAMFVNNAPSLWVGDGYDAPEHLAYVRYLLDHGRLPSPEQGWAMFQPPLYYVLAAATLAGAGIGPAEPGAGTALRMLSLGLGLAQLLLIFGCLRRVFPSGLQAQAVGMVVAAFLPLQLYMFQYVGNDALAATLSTAALCLGLGILSGERSSARAHAALGAVMGLALLAKLSAAVVVAVLLVVMAGTAVRDRRGAAGILRTLGVTALCCAAVSGWHYGSLWWRYGSPLLGNWDPGTVSPWWQDPGVLTARFFSRFGQALTAPLLSAYNSLADGIYTTLWGDGLIGGRSEVLLAPPWSLDLMAAGYALALAPTLLAVVGAVVLAARLIRRPSATGFVVVGSFAATAVAVGLWPMKVPIYSVVKAAFALPAVLALCALVAAGFEALARRPATRWLGWGVVLLWAMTSFATFWVPRGDATAEGRLGWILASAASTREYARPHLRAALEADPLEPLGRLGVAALSTSSGDAEAAIAELQGVVSTHPELLRARLGLARLLAARGSLDEAVEQLRAALETDPDLAQAHAAAGEILALVGKPEEAIAHYREALRAVPESSVVHRGVAAVLLENGRTEDGRWHLREAERLDAAAGREPPRAR